MKSLFCFCLGLIFTFSYTQDGSPDLSFGNNGYIIYEPEGDEHFIEGAIETNEGNILAVVSSSFGSISLVRIFAYNQEGLPLNEFGTNGILDLTGQFGYDIGISQLNGEGFLLHGYNSNQLIVSKHFNDGSLDVDFGNGGYLQTFMSGQSANIIRTDADNNIIVSGKQILSGVHHVLVKKFLDNGTQDNSFGLNGQVSIPVNDAVNLIVRSVVVKGDYYYLGINYNDVVQSYKTLLRTDTNGTFDSAYGTEGLLQIPIESDYFTSFDVFDNNTVLIGGMYFDYKTDNIFRKTIKVNSQGQQIQNFGNNGQIIGRSGFYIQENQRFIADASDFDFEGGTIPYYYRYFSNGTIDNSFQFGSNYPDVIGTAEMLHLQSGKFMLISTDIWYNWPDIKITLQRFNNNPLSISDYQKNNIAVYPNPSSGIFQIHNVAPFTNHPFQIFDSLGKKVLSGYLPESSPFIDLRSVDSGVYFLKISEISQTLKLLKK